MDLEKRLSQITKNVKEIVTIEELRKLIETEKRPKAYWGFECSGLMHLGMGLVCGNKIRNLVDADFDFTIFLADWHSWINNKLGGDIENIRICGEYFKHCFTAIGIPPDKVNYLWASDLVKGSDYWEKVIKIAKETSLQRVSRALPIMGRQLKQEDIEAASIFYPCMQAADIFQIGVDVACAGMDQRKAHMLARDVAEKLGFKKSISLHTPLLMGLSDPKKSSEVYDEDSDLSKQITTKMSKSIPGSSIYIHDSPEEIKKKIQNAYCPPKQVEENPMIEIIKYIILPERTEFEVVRPEKYGGNISFTSLDEIIELYRKEAIHPLDLKNSVAESLIEILKRVRDYFEKNPEPLEAMNKIEVTR
ncbi:MAG: tyrosine--tRNA ligase [Candidatus Bathyarchaeota archaeon]|nr:tyrosine--tRNA ligase [Candidatus Bathyarchaeota archaeon]